MHSLWGPKPNSFGRQHFIHSGYLVLKVAFWIMFFWRPGFLTPFYFTMLSFMLRNTCITSGYSSSVGDTARYR